MNKSLPTNFLFSFQKTPITDKDIPCLVFLHGLQSQKSIFDSMRQAMRKELPFSHMAVDFIGFGKSRDIPGFDYDLMSQAEALKDLLERENIRKIIIIGHSLGGIVGTLLLEMIPDKILALINMEGNLSIEDCGESRLASSLSLEEFKKSYYPALKKRLKESPEKSAAFRAHSLDLISDRAFYKTSLSIVSWSSSGKLFEKFMEGCQPKLLIRGEKSYFKSIPHGPNIESATISRSGHFMLLDNPQETCNAILHYLKQQQKQFSR